MIWKKVLLAIEIFFGVLFLIVGIAGLVLPIIPGIIFILIGMGLLGYPISLGWVKRFGRKIYSR